MNFSRRTQNGQKEAVDENQESDQVGPNVDGFIMETKPTANSDNLG